jgi:hypothetical protein
MKFCTKVRKGIRKVIPKDKVKLKMDL